MADNPLHTVLDHLRRLHRAADAAQRSDRELLHAFVTNNDQDAFAVAVTRHAPLVWGVCRRILGHHQDAEDAFQATFLILARRAGSVRWQASVGGWLHTVAQRLAVRARKQAEQRRIQEREASRLRPGDASLRELAAVVDEELRRLPAKYREPLLLHYMEGATAEAAARRLGLKRTTFYNRLAYGRELLRERLSRQGLSLAAPLLAAALTAEAEAASPSLIQATIRCVMGNAPERVAAMAAQMLGATAMMKRKLSLALGLLLGVAAGGVAMLPSRAPMAPDPQAERPTEPPKAEEKAAVRLDRYGDPLPPGALARLGTIRLRQGDSVFGLTFSPDGNTIASCNYWGDEDHAIYLWDVSSGKLLRRLLGHGRSILSLALSPDGKTLASTSRDKTIRLWDIATGKEIRRLDTPVGGHHFLTFSPDGRQLATTCSIPQGQLIALWDTVTGKEMLHLPGHEKYPLSLTFAPNGNSLASTSQGPNLTLWDLASGKEIRRLDIGGAPIYRRPVAFTPDGKRLAAGHADNTLRLWDVAAGVEVAAFRGHETAVVRLAFSADGKTLISAARDRTVRFWDVAAGKERRAVSINCDALTFDSVAFSPGEKLLAVGGTNNAIRLFDSASGKELRSAGHQAPVSALAFSPDGRAVTSISWDKTFRRWDATTGRELRRSGGLEATLLSCPLVANTKDNYISYLVYAACLSAGGGLLATGEGRNDARIHLWDGESGKKIRSFASNTGSVEALAFSPDGRVLASGSWDKTVRLWDVAGGKELRRFPGHDKGAFGNDGVLSVCFSSDGRWLASSGGDRTVRVWEVATGKELHRLRHETSVYTVAFSPDGRMLAAACSRYANEQPGYTGIVLWEIASGKERRRLDGREWVVGALAFSPDGRFLASGSADGTVRIWEPLTATERSRFAGHLGLVKSLAFSNDGGRLVSGGSDTTALVWDTGRLPPARVQREKPQKEINEVVWQDLAGADAARAYQAMARLVYASDSVHLLKKRLRPIAPLDVDKITRWINDLNSDTFAEREQASAELTKMGGRAEPALRRALGKSPSLEARRRIEALLDKLSHLEPQLLFSLRAVEVLEQIGSPQASEILQDLAAGDPEARLTREAKASLRRLDLRRSSPSRDR